LAKEVVLEQQQGVKAVLISGKIDNDAGQGELIERFIGNGFSRSYKTCKMELKRGSDGTWKLLNAQTHQPVASARMVTWAFGIKTIEGICPP